MAELSVEPSEPTEAGLGGVMEVAAEHYRRGDVLGHGPLDFFGLHFRF